MKMTKNGLKYLTCIAFTAILAVASIFTYEPALAQQTQSSYGSTYYSSPSLGFSIYYPSDWSVGENYNTIVFVSPQESNFDSHPERFLVSVIPNTNIPIRQIADQIPYALQTSLTDFVLLLSEPITINGNIAHQYVYQYYDSYFGPITVLEIFMTNGYNTYGLSYFAEPASYDYYLPTINSMINSLQVSTESITASPPPSYATDTDASGMLNTLGDEAELYPEVAEALGNMVETESAINDQIIANMNTPSDP